jgi:hypothetical protein
LEAVRKIHYASVWAETQRVCEHDPAINLDGLSSFKPVELAGRTFHVTVAHRSGKKPSLPVGLAVVETDFLITPLGTTDFVQRAGCSFQYEEAVLQSYKQTVITQRYASYRRGCVPTLEHRTLFISCEDLF